MIKDQKYLVAYQSMEIFIRDQKALCKSLSLDYCDSDPDLFIGISDEVLKGILPINGLRHPKEGKTSGWYIWAGTEFSDADDFFKTYCIKHLINIRAEIIKYLGLPPGYRFLIDNKGYEDIWFDEKLLDI